MDLLYIGVAVLLAVICFFVGRGTVTHREKLDNEQVLQEREKIQFEILEEKNKLLDIQTAFVETSHKLADTGKQLMAASKELAQQKANQDKILEEEKENTLASMKTLYEVKEEALEAGLAQTQARVSNSRDRIFQEKQIEIDSIRLELEKMKATRDAAIEAARLEKQLADSPQDHQIQLTEDEIHDINYLNDIRSRLYFPQLVGKLIWSSFLQKKLKTLTTTLLGTEKVCGIYKITDQLTQECYIGQSVDCAKRWSDHIKCGVGASPVSVGNALYTAIATDGIENFTFELLEACPQEQLNEKEAFYINLYSADTYGLNSKQGNKN